MAAIVYEFAAYAMNYSLWHPISFSVIQQDVGTQGGHLKFTNTTGANQADTVAYLAKYRHDQRHIPCAKYQVVWSRVIPSSVYHAKICQTIHFFVENKYRVSEKTTLVGALQYDKANAQSV